MVQHIFQGGSSYGRTHRELLGDPEQAEIKAQLAQRISEVIKHGQLTQAAAAKLMQVDQPKVSRLLRGQLTEFSTSRLLRFLTLLGRDVDIVIGSPPAAFAS